MALEKAAANIFIRKGVALNYYECPHCLDFHLTKNPNAKKINIRSDIFLTGWGRKSTEHIIKRNTNLMLEHFRQFRRGLKKQKKKGIILSLADQREALKKLSPSPY